MAEPYRTALFLFRRDLRLDDNTGLLEGLEHAERVIPAFVFDPRQQPDANEHFSTPAFEFLIESLADLDRQLSKHGGRLYRFEGEPHDVIGRIPDLDAVFVNRDYTPFSRQRDTQIQQVCAERGIHFRPCSDLLLHEPGEVLTGGGDPYRVFTPFYKAAQELDVPSPRRLVSGAFFAGEIDGARGTDLDEEKLSTARNAAGEGGEERAICGGRARALEIFDRLGDFRDYQTSRDLPAEDGTTRLSAHLKIGTVSPREVVHALRDALGGDAEPLEREVYWRDFFTQLAWFHPHVFEGSFKREYDAVEWDSLDDPTTRERFDAWCAGRTGFPIVDAGMRQLARSGWMHNRVRMIVACFLTKDLHVHWHHGERWFARHLVDYDPCVNNGNWQWAASTGADAQPYFRIFNPWSQQQKHDPGGDYIRRWVPELEGVEARDLHRLHEQRPLGLDGYPTPIVDHKEEREEALLRFRVVREH